ncbi:MAG: acylphosphatase [Erysipelotrichaceae bacterium]
MVRYYIIFSGVVQGVGFRYTLIKLAKQNDLTGWVRNRYDGKVEAQIQGEYFRIMDVIKQLQDSSGYIRIDDYSIVDLPLKENETDFLAVY